MASFKISEYMAFVNAMRDDVGSSGRGLWAALELTEEQNARRIELEEEFDGGLRNPAFRAELDRILTPGQRETLESELSRMRERRAARSLAGALEDAQGAMGLTEEQSAKVDELLEKVEDDELSAQALQGQLDTLLTPEQQAALARAQDEALAGRLAQTSAERLLEALESLELTEAQKAAKDALVGERMAGAEASELALKFVEALTAEQKVALRGMSMRGGPGRRPRPEGRGGEGATRDR